MGIHILSCTGCMRQLDVTALRLGDEICCVCDAVLTVGHPGPPDGGASVKGSHGPRVLPPIPRSRHCPRCDGGLRVHLAEHIEFIECGDCGGIWAQRSAFEHLLQEASGPIEVGPQEAEAQPHGQEEPDWSQEGLIPCPTCARKMVPRQFKYSGYGSKITLDVCVRHGIWFDEEELRRVLEFVRHVGGDFDARAAHLGFEPGTPGGIVTRKMSPMPVIGEKRSEGILGSFLDEDSVATGAVELVGWFLVALLE